MIVLIHAFVPFIGFADNGLLMCNAPCVVERNGVEILRTNGAVRLPLDLGPDGATYTVEDAR